MQPARLAALWACWFLLTPAYAGIYKWTDADGNVHYSDEKPLGGDAEELVITPPKKAGKDDVGEQRRLALVADVERASRLRAEEARTDAEQAARTAPDHSAACAKARRSYGALLEEMPVYRTADGAYRPHWFGDGYKGERTYINDAERQNSLQAVEADIYTFCNDPDSTAQIDAEYQRFVEEEFCSVARAALEAAEKPSSRTPRDEQRRLRQDFERSCIG